MFRGPSILSVGLLLLCACTSPAAEKGPSGGGAGEPRSAGGPAASSESGGPAEGTTGAQAEPDLMIGAPDPKVALERRINELPPPEGADPSAAVMFDALRQGRRKFIAAKASDDLRQQIRGPEFDVLSYAILGMGEVFVTAPERENLDEGGTRSTYQFGPADNPEAYTLSMVVKDGLLTDFRVDGDDLPERLVSYRGRLAPLQILDLFRTDDKGGVRGQGEVMAVGEKHPFHYYISGLQPGEDGLGHFVLSVKLTNHGTGDEMLLADKVKKDCKNLEALTQFGGRVSLGVKDPGTYTLDVLIEDEVSGEAVALSEPFVVVPADVVVDGQ